MPAKQFKAKEIFGKLREAEVLLNQRVTFEEVFPRIGVTKTTYYRWRREYGGMRVDQAQRLK